MTEIRTPTIEPAPPGARLRALTGLKSASGDLMVLIAMLGWSGYTPLQSRVAPSSSLLARVSLFAAAGALFSLPLALREMWHAPGAVFSAKAAAGYLFAGLVPGVIAYAGFAWPGAKFGALRSTRIRCSAQRSPAQWKFRMPDRAGGTKIADGDLSAQAHRGSRK